LDRRRSIGNPFPGSAAAAHPSMDAFPMKMKKKILVVDDEPDHCALVQRILEKAGFEVDVAYDGHECLQKVSADPPDAIVLDVVMPETNGHAVCKVTENRQELLPYPHNHSDGGSLPRHLHALFPRPGHVRGCR
jgi:PleD family two-component response regulator